VRTELLRRVRVTDRPVVVFDVDSTLLSTSARHHAILVDFAKEYEDHDVSAIVSTLGPDAFGWTVSGPLERAGVARPTLDALERYWRPRFFSGDYLDRDRPTPGAVEFVRQVHRAGAWITYLTARHLPEMGPATALSLLRLGFPLAEGRANLYMKPTIGLGDLAFKRVALDQIQRQGTVVATFENDPANANHLMSAFPDALNVLLDTVCAPDAPEPDPRLVRIPDFQRR
jgi:hypothetical protein